MKKLFVLILAPLFLMSCVDNSDEAQVERTAYKYLKAMGEYKIADAENYADDETRSITLQFFERKMMPYLDSAYLRSNTPAKITIGDVTIIDDTSALVTYHKSTPITEQDGELQMRKEDGKWKAHVVIKIPNIFYLDSDEMRTNAEKLDSLNGKELKLEVYNGPKPKQVSTDTLPLTK